MLDELEAAMKATSAGILTTAEVVAKDEWLECPCCQGSGDVQGDTYTNFDGLALGVQFFGIGEQFGAHERLWKLAVNSLPDLIAAARERDALRALVGKLNKYDIRLPNHLSHSDEDEDELSEVLMELAAQKETRHD